MSKDNQKSVQSKTTFPSYRLTQTSLILGSLLLAESPHLFGNWDDALILLNDFDDPSSDRNNDIEATIEYYHFLSSSQDEAHDV